MGSALIAQQALESSLRPVARPADPVVVTVERQDTTTQATIRPKPAPRQPVAVAKSAKPVETARPAGRQIHEPDAGRGLQPRTGGQQRVGLLHSLRPVLRSPKVEQRAMAQRRKLARGAVCGTPEIQGKVVGLVPGRIAGCGIKNAVRVRALRGIPLSRAALMDCTTAQSFRTWVETGLQPAVGGFGGGVARIRVVADYACRTRNNVKGAKISEHGRGRAVDIAGVRLRDGSSISVLKDWNRGRKGGILRQMHKSACGTFGTVLGPDSDRYHRNHFHFDTARYRSGAYCR